MSTWTWLRTFVIEDTLRDDEDGERVNQCLDEIGVLLDRPHNPPFHFNVMDQSVRHNARTVVFLPCGYYLSYSIYEHGVPPTHAEPCVVVRVMQLMPR